MASERKDSLSELTSASSSPAKMAVSIAMNGMEERSMSPAQLHINKMKEAMAKQQRQIEMRNAEIPNMLRQQIETGMKDFEDIESMVHTLRTLQISILRGLNLAKAALGEEPFNPRGSPMPAAAAASASASVPAPIAMRPPTYKESLAIAIPVEKPKEDEKDEKDEKDEDDEEDEEDEEDEDDEEDDDGFKKVKHHKKPEHCWHTKTGKHCHKADCKFTHPKGYQPGPRTICSNWHVNPKKNACKWDKNCKFLHAEECPYEDGSNFKEKK